MSGTVIGDAGSDGAGFAGLAGKGAAGTVTAGFLGLRRRAGTRELAAKAGQVLADGSLGVLAARSARSARLAALRHCAERIAAAQDNDGSWGQSPLVSALSLAALTELGYGPGHRVVGAGLRWFGLDVTPTEDREDETGGGPVPGLGRTGREVAITSLAVRALTDAGLPPGHPALTRADGWLGCHSARCVKGGPGNRAFASGVSRAGTFTSRPVAATSSAGRGWPTAAAAAGAVAVLSVAGESASPAARHGVVWLLRAQRADGAWPGPDSRGDEVSTGLAIRALVEAGVGPGKRPVRSAVRWLADRQRPDGAWEGGIASAAATAALLVAGGPGESAERGARWLADQICPDHAPAGADSALAVPVDVLCYQLSALGLFLSARAGGDGVIRR